MTPLQLRFFLQWSRTNEAWNCIECGGLAKGIETTRIKKNRRETFFQQDHSSLIHTDSEGEGNRLVHKANCKFLAAHWSQMPVASEMVA
jgi:hypothetical protein